jgi:Glycosyltransferase Family 4
MQVTHIGFSRPEESPFPDAHDPRHRFISAPRPASYRPLDLLRGTAGPLPFSVLNYSRKEMRNALTQLLGEHAFDIVLLEQVQMGGYLPALRRAANPPRAIVCDRHNIESEVLHRYADTASNPARRLYARHAASQLERYERRFVNQCDMHVAVSDRDRIALMRYGAAAPVVVIENGVDIGKLFLAADSQSSRRDRFRVVFCRRHGLSRECRCGNDIRPERLAGDSPLASECRVHHRRPQPGPQNPKPWGSAGN